MKKYDLNSAAIRTLASALKSGNLATIQTQFGELEDKQKIGLLSLKY